MKKITESCKCQPKKYWRRGLVPERCRKCGGSRWVASEQRLLAAINKPTTSKKDDAGRKER